MSEKAQYVTLGIGGELFAAPVEQVQEILDLRPIARLPQAPAHVLGMTDVRGDGIAVLDLRLTLGFAATDDTANTRIVVLQLEQPDRLLTLGLRCDKVYEVTTLDSDTLEPPPSIEGDWRPRAIAGIGRRNGAFVTVLDLPQLFAGSALALAA